jgi:hypothetical protein
MNNLKTFIQKWQAVLLIILLSILAYGLLIPWLGFYMDDWTFAWTYQLYGSQGLFSYFSSNRPFWGLTYQITMPLLRDNIFAWHIFGLVCRILLSLGFYWLMSLLWPKRKTLTLFAGLLFAVYPGFLLQPIALCFGHIWLVFLSFLLSNCFTVLALRNPGKRTVFTIIAVLFSIYNLLCMEYFLPLEVLRLIILFYLIAEPLPFIKRLGKAFKWWLPYFGVLLTVTIYRAFFYHDQTHIYSLQLLAIFKQNIWAGVTQLWNAMVSALYQSAIYAWVQPLTTLTGKFSLNRNYLGLLALIAVIFVGLFFILLRRLRTQAVNEESGWSLSALLMALFALVLAGIPFYLTSLPVEANTIDSRFTMPFMVGTALMLALLLDLISVRWLKVVLVSVILAASVGFHLLNENNFRLMGIRNKELMYEIAWRAPSLKPDTLVVSTEQDISQFYTPSTLRTELNLIYPHDPESSYGWLFARDLADLVPTPVQLNIPITVPMFTKDFNGNTDSAVVFQLSDHGCARFVDSSSSFISKEISDTSIQNISNEQNLVNVPDEQTTLDASLIGPEPAHRWCYYFEKSDLALQLNDYETVQKNYRIVIDQSLKPYYGYEWFPFIEGLARAGDWQSALSLSQQVVTENPTNDSYRPILCQMLNQAAEEASPSIDSASALSALNCSK